MAILVIGTTVFIGSNFLLDWLPTSNEDIISFDALTYSGNIAYLNFFY